MPDKILKLFQSDLLYNNKTVVLTSNKDRRLNNDNDKDNRSDYNLDDRIAKFHDLIGTTNVYRIPLRFLVDLELVSFLIKFDTKFVFSVKQNFSKRSALHRDLADAAVPNNPDAKIIFHTAPKIQYQKLNITDNLLISILVFLLSQSRIKSTLYHKSYKI